MFRGIRDARGGVSGILGVGSDVTQRRRLGVMASRLSALKKRLLGSLDLRRKLSIIAQGLIEIFGAEIARIWVTGPGDACGKGCVHAAAGRRPDACRGRSICLHMAAGAGRSTGLDGRHRRVPMQAYHAGRAASSGDPGFIIRADARETGIDGAWARSRGLVSAAGYRLLTEKGAPMGVLALFSRRAIPPEEAALLEDAADTASQVIRAGRAEEELKASWVQYRATVDSLGQALHVVDRDMRIILANRACARWARRFGARGKIVGRTLFEIFPFLPESVRGEYRRVFRTGGIVATEESHIFGGEEKITETRKLPVIEGGKTLRVITLIADVTARRKAEAAIRDSEEKYRALMEGASDAIILAGPDGRLVDANRAAVRMTGYSKKELRGRPFFRLHPPSERGRNRAALERAGRERAVETDDTLLQRRDGTLIPVDITGSRIRYGGREVTQGIVRDISERKRVETMRGNLIRDVSHELKSPIAVMEMAHAMARDALGAGDLGGVRRAQEIVARNLATLRKEVEIIVEMCALKGRTAAPKPARVSIGEIAAEVAGEIRDLAAQRKIAVAVRIGKGADRITADRRMMRSLLYNLMENAVKFTRRGSVSLSSSRAGNWLTIRIRDTGMGLGAKDADAAFTEFFKKNIATPGTGLGLPICREIASLHGGTVHLNSAGYGEGTTAVVRLPLRRPRARRGGGGSR